MPKADTMSKIKLTGHLVDQVFKDAIIHMWDENYNNASAKERSNVRVVTVPTALLMHAFGADPEEAARTMHATTA